MISLIVLQEKNSKDQPHKWVWGEDVSFRRLCSLKPTGMLFLDHLYGHLETPPPPPPHTRTHTHNFFNYSLLKTLFCPSTVSQTYRSSFSKALIKASLEPETNVSWCGLAVRCEASKQKNLGLIDFGSPFSSNIVVYGHCLVTLPTELMKHKNGSNDCPP